MLYKKELKRIADEELKGSSIKSYATFEAFLRDCPQYQLDYSASGKIIRNILKRFGIKFQQYVFIDKSSTEDRTAFLRKEGNILLHGKGTYLLPWDCQKDVIYFDIQDMRPLIDKTKDINWYNPDVCADVVTSITNSKTLEGMNGDSQSKYILILMVLSAISILVGIVGIYQGIESDKAIQALFLALNSSISNWGV